MRNIIYRDAIKRFERKGGENFTSLNGKDIESIFNSYDRLFFQNQIGEKIKSLGASIEFHARARTNGVIGICGLKSSPSSSPSSPSSLPSSQSSECTYYLDIAPIILARSSRGIGDRLSDPSPSSPGPPVPGQGPWPCNNRLECLLLIIELEIVHLLTLLWGYSNKSNTDVYGPHGLLFRCMIKEYFGHTRRS